MIKGALRTKNITMKNKMPDYMVRAGMNKGNINIDQKKVYSLRIYVLDYLSIEIDKDFVKKFTKSEKLKDFTIQNFPSLMKLPKL